MSNLHGTSEHVCEFGVGISCVACSKAALSQPVTAQTVENSRHMWPWSSCQIFQTVRRTQLPPPGRHRARHRRHMQNDLHGEGASGVCPLCAGGHAPVATISGTTGSFGFEHARLNAVLVETTCRTSLASAGCSRAPPCALVPGPNGFSSVITVSPALDDGPRRGAACRLD